MAKENYLDILGWSIGMFEKTCKEFKNNSLKEDNQSKKKNWLCV